ncbi:MAG TPA: type II toxin-antitoxin system HicA family toxin [Longimicrobium sp.]|nr:type II toxin-antitoxin system HicA family toxin [Longimicrobium sp.]
MSTRHRRTLEAVFRDPVCAPIVWDDVERMLVHYGADILEGRGSRISMELNGIGADLHRPHPQKEAKQYQIRAVRALLTQAGIEP